MNLKLKELYKNSLRNLHHKPLNWLGIKIDLQKKIQYEQKRSNLTEAELDTIFDIAKSEVLAEIGELK